MASVAILHYTAPFVMGGVEAVIEAHARLFSAAGHTVTIIAGRGGPQGESYGELGTFKQIPEMDSENEEIERLTEALWRGVIPDGYQEMQRLLFEKLEPVLHSFENVIVHNVLTKEFNLPLTAALFQILDQGVSNNWINWCHDAAWASRRRTTRDRVRYPGPPWNLLRSFDPRVTWVTGSDARREDLANAFTPPSNMTRADLVERIRVIYNGVDADALLGLSYDGRDLVNSMNLFASDLIMLMPVRISQAKNIEFAIEVTRHIKDKGKNPRLVVSGPPDAHNRSDWQRYVDLKETAAARGLSTNVFFAYDWVEKNVEPEDRAQGLPYALVAELYRVSDVLLMPSRREGFGIPVFEAALVGMPFFCSDNVPAVKELQSTIPTFDLPPEGDAVAFEKAAAREATNICERMFNDEFHLARVQVRRRYKWSDIYRYDIEPLLSG